MKILMRSLLLVFTFVTGCAIAQTGKPVIIRQDSTTSIQNPALTRDTIMTIVGKDTIKTLPKHDPRKATMRSLILPGWGQAYNREYWKIPIVYGALGAAVGIYMYNNNWYKRTKTAYEIRITNDTGRFEDIYPRLKPLSAQSLLNARNSFRRDRDYSVLWFLILWGVNIIDATVFGHLKDFDVSEDLSLKVNPVIKQSSTGLSLVLGFKTPPKRLLSVQ
jgi:hypothetical protein